MTVNSDRRTAGPQDRTTRYIRNSRAISGRLHEELVMMDPEQGKYFSLNRVATRIWDLLEKPMDIDQLCVVLLEEYEISQDRCHEEVGDYLRQMLRLGLIAGSGD